MQKPDLQFGYVRAGLNDFKTDLMTSNYKNIDRKLVKVNLIIITTSTLHGSSCSKWKQYKTDIINFANFVTSYHSKN